jgi:predicted XRE-type DNA-binding protein
MLDDPIPKLKQHLAKSILETIESKWYIYERVIGLDQPRLSNLERGQLDRFSVQKLIRVLAILNRRVDIKVVAVAAVPSVAELKLAQKRNNWRSGGM